MDRTDPKMRFTLPSDRQPVGQDKLISLQKACQETDDEMRWLLALISDTGMRLSEAAGLYRDDIVLDAPIPHISLTAHPWRRLKTKSIAMWERLCGQHRGSCSMIAATPSHAIAMGRHVMPTQLVLR